MDRSHTDHKVEEARRRYFETKQVINTLTVIKMEKEEKLVKVYSNNSKKARLKRRKNKFQRIWDAEKQTYIKVRKAKYPVYPKKEKKDWRDVDKSAALKRRHETPKKPKSAPVIAKMQKPETKKQTHKNPTCKSIEKKPVIFRINGVAHTWDSKTLRYKLVA